MNTFKMNKSIDDISEKQRLKLKEWQDKNPDYESNGTKSEEFFNIVRSIMGGGDDIELNKNKNRIIKSLSSDVSIKSVLDDNKQLNYKILINNYRKLLIIKFNCKKYILNDIININVNLIQSKLIGKKIIFIK